MARFNVRNLLHGIARDIKNLATRGDLNRRAGEVLDEIEQMWRDYIDDPDLGFGTASYPGKRGQINYTGEAKSGIQVTRAGLKLEISENHPRLAQIRMGTESTGKFDRDAYLWAWQKALGQRDTSVIGRRVKDPATLQLKRRARQMAFAVAYKGTSSYYALHRFHGPTGSARGFDYPGQFMFLYEGRIDRLLDDAALKMQRDIGDALIRVGN